MLGLSADPQDASCLIREGQGRGPEWRLRGVWSREGEDPGAYGARSRFENTETTSTRPLGCSGLIGRFSLFGFRIYHSSSWWCALPSLTLPALHHRLCCTSACQKTVHSLSRALARFVHSHHLHSFIHTVSFFISPPLSKESSPGRLGYG